MEENLQTSPDAFVIWRLEQDFRVRQGSFNIDNIPHRVIRSTMLIMHGWSLERT